MSESPVAPPDAEALPTEAEASPDEARRLTAFYRGTRQVSIRPASRQRPWLPETPAGSARRCLPLLMANQCGWVLACPTGLAASWDGGNETDAVTITVDDPAYRRFVSSDFGHGIVTFTVPFLFRTPPGWQLHVRGPANSPKDGIGALEGVVETDWSVATFTMNWQLTRPDNAVRFERGEPYCMVTPVRLDALDGWEPGYAPIETSPGDDQGLRAWNQGRHKVKISEFLRENGLEATEQDTKEYELLYFRGTRPDGSSAPLHRTNVQLRHFTESAPVLTDGH